MKNSFLSRQAKISRHIKENLLCGEYGARFKLHKKWRSSRPKKLLHSLGYTLKNNFSRGPIDFSKIGFKICLGKVNIDGLLLGFNLFGGGNCQEVCLPLSQPLIFCSFHRLQNHPWSSEYEPLFPEIRFLPEDNCSEACSLL